MVSELVIVMDHPSRPTTEFDWMFDAHACPVTFYGSMEDQAINGWNAPNCHQSTCDMCNTPVGTIPTRDDGFVFVPYVEQVTTMCMNCLLASPYSNRVMSPAQFTEYVEMVNISLGACRSEVV